MQNVHARSNLWRSNMYSKIFLARLKTFSVARSSYNYFKEKLLEIHAAFMTVRIFLETLTLFTVHNCFCKITEALQNPRQSTRTELVRTSRGSSRFLHI